MFDSETILAIKKHLLSNDYIEEEYILVYKLMYNKITLASYTFRKKPGDRHFQMYSIDKTIWEWRSHHC